MIEDPINIKKAIQEAQKEYDCLSEKLKGYEEIRANIAQLKNFIDTGNAILGIEEVPEGEVEGTLFPDEGTQPENHLGSIKKILTDARRELSLSEITEEYSKRNWKLSEANGREVLRNVVNKKIKEFHKTFKGNQAFYSLVT